MYGLACHPGLCPASVWVVVANSESGISPYLQVVLSTTDDNQPVAVIEVVEGGGSVVGGRADDRTMAVITLPLAPSPMGNAKIRVSEWGIFPHYRAMMNKSTHPDMGSSNACAVILACSGLLSERVRGEAVVVGRLNYFLVLTFFPVAVWVVPQVDL